MKKLFRKIIQTSVLCVFMISATLSFAEVNKNSEIENLKTIQNQNSFPNIFHPITDFVKKIFGKKTKPISCFPFAKIKSVTISNNEVENCSINDKNSVEVTLETDHSQDLILYKYQVSGGKIIENRNTPLTYGNKDKLIWDLTGVPTGEYVINVSVDHGCGDCSPQITKTIKVVDCPK